MLYETSQGPLSSLGMCAGPCGGCSELYYDFFPERGTAGADLEDDSRQALCLPFCVIGCCADVTSCPVTTAHDRVMMCRHVCPLIPCGVSSAQDHYAKHTSFTSSLFSITFKQAVSIITLQDQLHAADATTQRYYHCIFQTAFCRHLAVAEDIAHKADLLAKLPDGCPAGSLSTTT